MTSQREQDILLEQALNNQIDDDALDEDLISLVTLASQVQSALEITPSPPHGLRPGRSAFLTAAQQQKIKRAFTSFSGIPRTVAQLMPFIVVLILAILLGTMFIQSGALTPPSLPGKSPHTVTPTITPTLTPSPTPDAQALPASTPGDEGPLIGFTYPITSPLKAATATPTPTPTPTSTSTKSPTKTSAPSGEETPSPQPQPTPTAISNPSSRPNTPPPSPLPTVTPTVILTPDATPTRVYKPTATPTKASRPTRPITATPATSTPLPTRPATSTPTSSS